MAKDKERIFICCAKSREGCHGQISTMAPNLPLARLKAHRKGWASTSMDSPTALDICPECFKHHKEYAPGRRFKVSMWADLDPLPK